MVHIKKRVLFLCTGNACRSQMAEGWAKLVAGEEWEVFSAGVEAHGLHPKATDVMAEAGVDIQQQRSEILHPDLLESMDLVVSVCDHALHRLPPLPPHCRHVHWSLPDPAQASGSPEQITQAFRFARDTLKDHIVELFHRTA